MVELSIIIPTWNEERDLPNLLTSIKSQRYRSYEIIIADNNSNDNTRKIGRSFKAKIVKGGLPAKARNNGAKVAKGNLLLFIDADAILPVNSLTKLVKKFKEEKLDVASVYLTPISKKIVDKFLHGTYNLWAKMMQFIDPHLTGAFILVRKDIFNKLKGFDEKVSVAEDHAFGRLAKLHGAKIKILKEARVLISVRRLDQEGRFVNVVRYISWGFHRTFIGEIKNRTIGYKWRKSKS